MHAKQELTDPLLHEFYAYKVEPNSRGASFFETVFNGINAMSGVGTLSIPYALSYGGWLSLILLLIIASTTFYTGLLIKKCMEVDPYIKSYSDIGYRAFGKKGRVIVSVVVNLELYLTATGFLILVGDNLHKLFPDVEINIYGILIGGRQSFVLLAALIIIPTVWIDDLTVLSYVSATGILAAVVILGSVLWSGIFDGVGFQQKGVLLNWSGLPTAFSLYSFCYCGHTVFPTLYSSMRNQRQFPSVLLLTFAFCTTMYVIMGVLGYRMFGSEVLSQITLNLPTDKLSSKVAIYNALINPIAKYALILKPVVNTIEEHSRSYTEKRVVRLFMRTALVGSSVTVALTLPFFGHLLSLVGALLSIPASILFPCFSYLKISQAYERKDLEFAVIVFAVLIGLIIFVVGTYISVVQIVHDL